MALATILTVSHMPSNLFVGHDRFRNSQLTPACCATNSGEMEYRENGTKKQMTNTASTTAKYQRKQRHALTPASRVFASLRQKTQLSRATSHHETSNNPEYSLNYFKNEQNSRVSAQVE
ncbi:MAG TPA: hypothetical protein VLA12_22300, partial [Planctomycetaceae bacterium]|nr:hypothetical protein [Planctomycetaceae bacterium]